jgi:hypothetical protein
MEAQQPELEDLTRAQHERLNALCGGTLFTIPDGSVLLVQRDEFGRSSWIEVLEPTPTCSHAFDLRTV